MPALTHEYDNPIRRPPSCPDATVPQRGGGLVLQTAALIARRDGARYTANNGRVARPCEPDDVVKCLDTLYCRRRIDLVHARIMRIWGERQTAPNPAYAGERCDWRLWAEALDRLEWPLRVKGIVA